jgi:hypothetical protein
MAQGLKMAFAQEGRAQAAIKTGVIRHQDAAT